MFSVLFCGVMSDENDDLFDDHVANIDSVKGKQVVEPIED
jgi:hypothetical protein